MTKAEKMSAAVLHIEALISLAGLDQSESATMTFVDYLDEAARAARIQIRRSLKQGLCLDCRWIIAETLLREAMKEVVQ